MRLTYLTGRQRSTIWKVLHRHGRSRRRRSAQRESSRRYEWSEVAALLHIEGTVATPVAVLVAIAATSAYASAVGATGLEARLKPISAGSAFVFPQTTQCVKGRVLTIRIRKLPGVRFVSAVVNIDGKTAITVKRAQIAASVTLRDLPNGSFVLSITARTGDGRTAKVTRTYYACTRQTDADSYSNTDAHSYTNSYTNSYTDSPPTGPVPGSYSGTYADAGISNDYDAVTFFVNPQRTEVQDLRMPEVYLPCTPKSSSNQYVDFHLADIPIKADGSFEGGAEEGRVIEGVSGENKARTRRAYARARLERQAAIRGHLPREHDVHQERTDLVVYVRHGTAGRHTTRGVPTLANGLRGGQPPRSPPRAGGAACAPALGAMVVLSGCGRDPSYGETRAGPLTSWILPVVLGVSRRLGVRYSARRAFCT